MYKSILFKVLNALQYTINEKNEKHYDGYIRYTPYKHSYFERELKLAILHTDGKKFLEVGCGIGDKCVIAKDIFNLDVKGIELDKHLCDIARRLMIMSETGQNNYIYNISALDFTDYNLYDIIYIYKPVSGERQLKLETMIKDNMKSGAVLIAPLLEYKPDKRFKQLSENVWIKKKP